MSNKPKCPVFGCTIPRGIPHEHPAGVSVVMRDPVEPLTRDERAELESFRRERDWLTREGLKAFSQHSTYVVPADAPMTPGRKLIDALVLAGHKPGDTLTFEEVKPAPRRSFFREMFQVPHRSFAHLVGHIAFAVVCGAGFVLALFMLAVAMGWLS